MSHETIVAWTNLILACATLAGIPGGVLALYVKYRIEKLRADQGMAREKSITDIIPTVVIVGAGLAWAYLFSQSPQVVRLLPAAESAELVASAMPSPSAASCTSAADCRSGCACTGGQCTPCSAIEKKPKPQPPQKKPRLVASMGGTLCADCLRLPQMITPIAQPFGE